VTTSIHQIVEGIHPINQAMKATARERTARLVMPPRALGRLHEIGERLCGIQGTLRPAIRRKAVLVMAGDHGVVAEGISAFPQEVTGAMIRTFLAGGAGINAIARHVGAEVWVADMGILPDLEAGSLKNGDHLLVRKVGRGTRNFARGPAMTVEEAHQAVLTGFELASGLIGKGVDLLGTGDMGIGNTTPSAAIGAAVTGKSLDEMVGRGTGVDDSGLARKRAVIRRGLDLNRPDPRDGIDLLAKVGGFEIGGIAGIVLAGAHHRKPVVVDGFISTAGALIAQVLCPQAIEYVFAGHCSEEPGHRHMLAHLKLAPILDLGMRLGEGTGGALAMNVIEAAIKVMTEVMTFEEAQVPEKE
jgi:nicotinate-nucleotide--dimethylbenzimidazole phosphoribosyltransferase